MRKGIEIVESMNNKVKGSDKRKMKNVISMGIVGLIVSTMLLASMASPALANESSAASAYTPRAFVYGDANEDATVDMRDVTYIKLVLFKKKPETKLADANYDGKISMLDVGQTKLIVLGKEKELTLLDMADRTVTIPQPPEIIVPMSQGLIDQTMVAFGIEDRIVGYSSCGKIGVYDTSKRDTPDPYQGSAYIGSVLYPKMIELPWVGKIDAGINYETVATLCPDLVIIRITCCQSEDNVKRVTEAIESMGIPVVIIEGPGWGHPNPSVEVIYDEIETLGEVLDNQEKAQELIDFLDEKVTFIKERTSDIPEEEKPKVLYFGAAKGARGKGGCGYTQGMDSIEAVFLEDIINAKYAYKGTGSRVLLSAEQVLALNPDVIVLPTWSGFHPPRELYELEEFGSIREVKAIKERRVGSLPHVTCRSERLTFAMTLMIEAKIVYPERFEDVDLNEFVDEYYKNVFGVSDEQVELLKKAQRLRLLEIIE